MQQKIQLYQELHQCQKAVPRGRKWRVGGDMFCFMNGDDFSIPVEQPHFVLVDAASISLCLAFLSVTNRFYATLGFFGMGCQTNSPLEAGRLVEVLDKNNRNCWHISVSLVSYCLIHISTAFRSPAPGLLISTNYVDGLTFNGVCLGFVRFLFCFCLFVFTRL